MKRPDRLERWRRNRDAQGAELVPVHAEVDEFLRSEISPRDVRELELGNASRAWQSKPLR